MQGKNDLTVMALTIYYYWFLSVLLQVHKAAWKHSLLEPIGWENTTVFLLVKGDSLSLPTSPPVVKCLRFNGDILEERWID